MNIAIDFGTTNTTVAWFNPVMNKVESIAVTGEDKVPSVIYWPKKEHRRRFGVAAEREFETVAKRILSAEISNDLVNVKAEREALKGFIRSVKMHMVEDWIVDAANGRRISPEVFVVPFFMYLRDHVLQMASSVVKREVRLSNERIEITLTHPVEWAQKSKGYERLKKAAEDAGFTVVKMLPEPVSAIYGAARCQGEIPLGDGVLVFDLGGGTLDIAYLTKRNDGRYALAVPPKGCQMAGDKFDDRILAYLEKEYKAKIGRGFTEPEMKVYRRDAQNIKHRLSNEESVTFEPLVKVKDATKGKDVWKGILIATIDRENLKEILKYDLDNINRFLVDYVDTIKEKNLSIDTVLLVGGSTQMPIIQELVERVTGIKPIRHPQSDVLVALGAVKLPEHANKQVPNNGTTCPVDLNTIDFNDLRMRAIEGHSIPQLQLAVIYALGLHGENQHVGMARMWIKEALGSAVKEEDLQSTNRIAQLACQKLGVPLPPIAPKAPVKINDILEADIVRCFDAIKAERFSLLPFRKCPGDEIRLRRIMQIPVSTHVYALWNDNIWCWQNKYFFVVGSVGIWLREHDWESSVKFIRWDQLKKIAFDYAKIDVSWDEEFYGTMRDNSYSFNFPTLDDVDVVVGLQDAFTNLGRMFGFNNANK